MSEYKACALCAHRCGADRTAGGLGRCHSTDRMMIARAALHFWEEPPISGSAGSGAVFFSGCSLGCVFCQNKEISRGMYGREVSASELSDIFFRLGDDGALNVNLVTPTHFLPTVREAIALARRRGFSLPFVYNTSGYDTPEALRTLDGLIDVYLPDFKYAVSELAARYSFAPDYPRAAKAALAEMVRQQPRYELGEDGILRRGVIVRVLVLPAHLANAKLTLRYLRSTYGDAIRVSIMNQYTPSQDLPHPLHRPLTRDEYAEVLDYAVKIGITDAFIQEEGTAKESFIPPFDMTGL